MNRKAGFVVAAIAGISISGAACSSAPTPTTNPPLVTDDPAVYHAAMRTNPSWYDTGVVQTGGRIIWQHTSAEELAWELAAKKGHPMATPSPLQSELQAQGIHLGRAPTVPGEARIQDVYDDTGTCAGADLWVYVNTYCANYDEWAPRFCYQWDGSSDGNNDIRQIGGVSGHPCTPSACYPVKYDYACDQYTCYWHYLTGHIGSFWPGTYDGYLQTYAAGNQSFHANDSCTTTNSYGQGATDVALD